MGCFKEMSIEKQQAENERNLSFAQQRFAGEAEKQADFIIKPTPGKVYSEEEAKAVAENIMCLSIRFRKMSVRMAIITIVFTMTAYIIGYLIGSAGY